MKMKKAIMHLDGDAFFVSVEAAKDPFLRGKAVVTGQERGIASALSYEAKALGITRAMPIFEIRKRFPKVLVVSSDYESYAMFSSRMFAIVRRHTDLVEEYSIDECFAEFPAGKTAKEYHKMLSLIKDSIQRELGITVSLGLGPTKVIAKTASKAKKPNGLTIAMDKDLIRELLSKTKIESVWGIGSSTSIVLKKKGIQTAYDFTKQRIELVRELFSKPIADIWHELNGQPVLSVDHVQNDPQASISKTLTFSPGTKNRDTVFAELSRNIENACAKARERGLVARGASFYTKTKDWQYFRAQASFIAPTSSTADVIEAARKAFPRMFDPAYVYRSTGVTLHGLMPATHAVGDLFVEPGRGKPHDSVYQKVDALNRRYGRAVVGLASSLEASKKDHTDIKREAFHPVVGTYRRLSIPFLGDVR